MGGTERTKVLITVMTYPHPSKSRDEVVCTAGITEAGDWVRLYPVDYRYRPSDQRFHKYQWISVELEERGARNDGRRESRKPVLDSIRLLGEPLPTTRGWEARRVIIDSLPHHTVNELKALYEQNRTSLGIVRPVRVLDMEIVPASSDWKPEWQAIYSQMRLFGPPPKPLTKIPYRFRYVFECEDSESPHTAMNEDWELGVRFLRLRERLGDAGAAAAVREHFLNVICGADKDTRFFMGTFHPYNTWLVLGTFYPPRVVQQGLPF